MNKKKRYKNVVLDITTERKFKMGDDIITVPETKKMTYAQRNTLILFLHKKGYSYSWIAKCLGTTPIAVERIVGYYTQELYIPKKKKNNRA